MSIVHTVKGTIKPTDLRGILEYVPMFRDHVFVIALDGSLVAHDNFENVLLDIAVLRSLNIKVVLAYGIGHQLQSLSQSRGIPITDAYGEGKTDAQTLELAVEASAMVSSTIMQGITRNGLRCALTNAVRSKEAGISKGEDLLFSGTIDKLDITFFNHLLDTDTIPVVAPIAFSREGISLRINSDLLAAELSSQLGASKLIYLTTQDGLQLDGQPLKNLPVGDLETLLEKDASTLPARLKSKALYVVKAIDAGTPRSHILDGRLFGALLNEVFDKVGIGTMIYSNEYQSIRRAVKADSYAIYTITQNGVRSETLVYRSQDMIQESIDDYLVYEIDGSIVGCINLQKYAEDKLVEIGSVYVQPFYQNKGVGRRLIEYAKADAKNDGVQRLLALTTQAVSFFTKLCGFTEGSLDDLPAARRADYETNGRNSKILYKDL
jgi:amino-acid N-acetyltransferase